MEVALGKFESLTYRELQKAAKSRGLNAGGKKENILQRLNVRGRELLSVLPSCLWSDPYLPLGDGLYGVDGDGVISVCPTIAREGHGG